MKNLSLAVSCVSLLVGSVAAQSQVDEGVIVLEDATVTHVGTYHLATGTLSPIASTQLNGLLDDPIYNNDAFTGMFLDILDGRMIIDEGRIPSPTSVGVVGTQTSYSVSGFQIGYATDATDSSLGGTGVSFRLDFYDSWSSCAAPSTEPAPIFSTVIGPLPGSTDGTLSAFTLEVDTAGTGFCIQADGDGVYTDGMTDLFGWSIVLVDGADSTATGPLISGGPASGGAEGDGTAFQNPTDTGSGLSTQDLFTRVDFDGTETCRFFNGDPFASFYMLIRADTSAGCLVGTDLCPGVANSTGDGAILRSSGSSAAVDNDLILATSGLPTNTVGYYLVSQDDNVVMNPAGSSGTLCIASTAFGRYAGDVLNSTSAGQVAFEPDLTMIPLASGGGTSFTVGQPGDTYNFQYWYRDVDSMGIPTSNFSSATSVTLQ